MTKNAGALVKNFKQNFANDKHLGIENSYTENSGASSSQLDDAQNILDTVVAEQNFRSQPFYVLGRTLRQFWDSLPSFSLPVAEARGSKQKGKKLRLDDEFEKVLSGARISFDLDKSYSSKSSEKRLEVIISNVRDEFRKAASEDPETRGLIMQCLDKVEIKILDEKYSKDKITSWWKKFGRREFLGLYYPESSSLILRDNFEGKNKVGMIVHECGHVKDFFENIYYDESKIDECYDNLRSLGVRMIKCLDSGESKQIDCKELKELASQWRNRTPLSNNDLKGEKSAFGATNIISRYGDNAPKLVKNEVAVQIDCEEVRFGYPICTKNLVGMVDAKTDKMRQATADEENLFKAATELYLIDSPTVVQEHQEKFGASPQTIGWEKHATIVDNVPRSVITKVCSNRLIDEGATIKNGKKEF